jgi:hypothetical protein
MLIGYSQYCPFELAEKGEQQKIALHFSEEFLLINRFPKETK